MGAPHSVREMRSPGNPRMVGANILILGTWSQLTVSPGHLVHFVVTGCGGGRRGDLRINVVVTADKAAKDRPK